MPEEIDLTPEQDAALDRAWDSVGERKPATKSAPTKPAPKPGPRPTPSTPSPSPAPSPPKGRRNA